MRRFVITCSLTALLFGGACGGDDSPSESTATTNLPSSDPVGIANPASEFCVEQGGTVEIVEEEGGQVGYCNLPDGSRIEEWEYFRANSPAGS
ncbi:MAG: hypothetical protein RIS41_934 [Actinomycetota bacterium]|jgi:putative hemolysin